jgi:DNA-binding transcriptional MerR regulator
MKIGKVAARASVTTRAFRYYEPLGLITPARLSNGNRDYGEHDVLLVREVRSLSQLGIPVERTRPFLESLATGRDHADDCLASLAAHRDAVAELTERIEALSAKRAALAAQLHDAALPHQQRGGG